MTTSYGNTSGFSVVEKEELLLVNGGKGGGGGGSSGSGSYRKNSISSSGGGGKGGGGIISGAVSKITKANNSDGISYVPLAGVQVKDGGLKIYVGLEKTNVENMVKQAQENGGQLQTRFQLLVTLTK